MLQYERIGVSERIDLDKTNESKECITCHYWFSKGKDFNFWTLVCNCCHDISMMYYELENIAIFRIKGVDYKCIFWNVTYNEAFNFLNNSKLDEKDSL